MKAVIAAFHRLRLKSTGDFRILPPFPAHFELTTQMYNECVIFNMYMKKAHFVNTGRTTINLFGCELYVLF